MAKSGSNEPMREAATPSDSGQNSPGAGQKPESAEGVPGLELPQPGSEAPAFELEDDTGVLRRLSEFRGKPVLLYFYPADDTPGCTKEACNFRDDYSAFQGAGVTILGISPDSVQSHAKFRTKYGLPFRLLSDPGHIVCSRYGVWGEKKFMGRTFDGVLRTTFLIDESGRIDRVFENVRPAEHSEQLLRLLGSRPVGDSP